MSQKELVYLEALKASETTEAPGIGLTISSDKLSIPSGVKTLIRQNNTIIELVDHKPSRSRWIAFTDYITGLGIDVSLEHINGSDNTLADALSRLVYSLFSITEWPTEEEQDDMEVITGLQQLEELIQPFNNMNESSETDGCMEGWGGVCKWKLAAKDPRSTEQICAYASGKFNPIKSTIDAEIYACMNSLESFKILQQLKRALVE